MALQNGNGADLVDGSYNDVQAVTASDTISDAHRLRDVRGIRADVGGNLTVVSEAAAVAVGGVDGNLTAAGVQLVIGTGELIPLRVAYVLTTGTTATGLKVFL